MKTPAVQLLLCCLLLKAFVYARQAPESGFTLLTKKEGLSHEYITALAQDSTGFLWVATQSGLNRFNGSNFVQYHSTEAPSSLPAEKLNGLVWLDKYRLLAFNVGMHIIDTRTGETKNVFIPYKDLRFQYKFNWIIAVLPAANGDIYALARSGFYHFDKNYRLLFRFDYYPDNEVAGQGFGFGGQLFTLGKDLLGISAIDGFYAYNLTQRTFKKVNETSCPAIAGFTSGCIFLQPFSNELWVINPFGDSLVYITTPTMARRSVKLPFTKAGNAFDYHTQAAALNDSTAYLTGKACGYFLLHRKKQTGELVFEPHKYAGQSHCTALMEDRDHHLWVATSKGLLRQEESHPLIETADIPPLVHELFPNMRIDNICEAGKWIITASRSGGGLLVFDKNTLQFNRRISLGEYRTPGEAVFCLLAVNDSLLLAGSYGPLLQISTENWLVKPLRLPGWDEVHDWIADMANDVDGGVWIAAGKLYHYNPSTGDCFTAHLDDSIGKKIEEPHRIGYDRDGNLWLAGHGLLRYNNTTRIFDRYIDSFPFIKMADRQVNSFAVDYRKRIWLNSNNNGLACYDPADNQWKVFTTADGLPDNNIADMKAMGNKLWLATFSGIACIDLSSFHITSFDAEDGLPDLPVYISARFSDGHNGKATLGFTNTLARFDAALGYQKTETPRLFIESITTVRGQDKAYVGSYPLKQFTTTWNNSGLMVTIGTINFFTNQAQRFAFRITGNRPGPWTSLGKNNSFSIASLAPGDHLIEVKLTSLNHRWPDKIISFTISVIPPLWMESWFAGLVFVSLFLAVYTVFHRRVSAIKRKEQTKTAFAKLKAEEYKMQYELEQISHFFSSALPGDCDIDEMLHIVAKDLIGKIYHEDCVIYLWDNLSNKLVPKAICRTGRSAGAGKRDISDLAARQDLVKYMTNVREALRSNPEPNINIYRINDHRFTTHLYVPIVHSRELLGAIDTEHPGKDYFQERDIKILTTIATMIAGRIKQIESMHSLQIKQREIAHINQQLAEAQLSALQTQMNPHFIFNALNSIKGMILNNEQRQASKYLSKFANMIRMTLTQSKQVFITLDENVEYLETYLAMEQLRFDDSFSYRCEVQEDIDRQDVLVPALMIQPLAENGIWHGLLNKEGEKNITVRFSKTNEEISCVVEDNGIGINRSLQQKKDDRPAHQPVGLTNLRNRIAILNEKYATCCSLEITDLTEHYGDRTGTRAVLRFNLLSNTTIMS